MKEGIERVNDIMFKQIDGSNLLPKPVTYEDIDNAFNEFVSNELNTNLEGIITPTYFFTHQRMSEFTKTWEMVDENKNIIPNFKIIVRENNPKVGSMLNGFYNIPGNQLFTLGSFNKRVGSENVVVTYKMKQPYCVDISYNVRFITNKMTLLNSLNNIVLDKFKSKQAYVCVNGHYMMINLEDIGDESEYDINQRKIFIQNFKMVLSGYIINENDIVVEENLTKCLLSVETDIRKPKVYYLNKKKTEVEFSIKGSDVINFKSDRDFSVSSIEFENVSYYDILINGVNVGTSFNILKFDRIFIKIIRENRNAISKIIFK